MRKYSIFITELAKYIFLTFKRRPLIKGAPYYFVSYPKWSSSKIDPLWSVGHLPFSPSYFSTYSLQICSSKLLKLLVSLLAIKRIFSNNFPSIWNVNGILFVGISYSSLCTAIHFKIIGISLFILKFITYSLFYIYLNIFQVNKIY